MSLSFSMSDNRRHIHFDMREDELLRYSVGTSACHTSLVILDDVSLMWKVNHCGHVCMSSSKSQGP